MVLDCLAYELLGSNSVGLKHLELWLQQAGWRDEGQESAPERRPSALGAGEIKPESPPPVGVQGIRFREETLHIQAGRSHTSLTVRCDVTETENVESFQVTTDDFGSTLTKASCTRSTIHC